jgi:phage baseplate assembly protein W
MTYPDYPQLGRGWAFPPRWEADASHGVAVLATTEGLAHVQEAIRVLLRTAVGSRVMRPGLGAGVDRYVFEPRTPEVCHRLANDMERALLLWEPRIIVDAVDASPAGVAEDRIDVRIDYRVDRHSRPSSLVLPFFLETP